MGGIMKKAIIFQGGWEGHEPVQVSEVFKNILETEGFNVELYDNMECLSDAENLKTFDLIVPMWTMGDIKSEYVQNICSAVENGTGIAGCHGGMCDSFRLNAEWQFLTGSQFVSHPGGDVEYSVNFIPGTGFTQGLEEFSIKSEQYYLHIDPVVKVFATTKFPVADGPHVPNGEVAMPVGYTKLWGKGRVFYFSLGHNAACFDIPQVKEIMKRGLVWASK